MTTLTGMRMVWKSAGGLMLFSSMENHYTTRPGPLIYDVLQPLWRKHQTLNMCPVPLASATCSCRNRGLTSNKPWICSGRSIAACRPFVVQWCDYILAQNESLINLFCGYHNSCCPNNTVAKLLTSEPREFPILRLSNPQDWREDQNNQLILWRNRNFVIDLLGFRTSKKL